VHVTTNCLHFFWEKLALNFNTISLFTNLHSFVWLKESNGIAIGIFKYAQQILKGLEIF